jgi:hypothetical protein
VAEDVGVVALLALVYRHPAIALPVLGAILLATAFLVPLLFRALALVLRGFLDAVQSLFGQGHRDQIPPWVEWKALELSPEGASEALPCYVRRVRGVPRFKAAYLVQVEGRWQLVYRRWYHTRSLELADAPARCFSGFLWDSVVFLRDRRPEVLLVSRAWRHALAVPIVRGV